MNKKVVYTIISGLICLLFFSCATTNYIEKNYTTNLELLKTSAPYTSDPVAFEIKELISPERTQEIRSYFKENTELDLDALAASSKSTWEKAQELACFVAKNIPHDNQKEMLEQRNAITLWEYSRRVKTGFNCRWHSTLLSELLLSIGIKNRFITCLPYDKNDSDCHVVNIVWLPELNKWAMIDSDMLEYVTDDNGTPLSLAEMRTVVVNGGTLNINTLPGFDSSWVAKPAGKKYMKAYWTKNLYWFSAHTTYGFDLEGTRSLPDSYVCLVPPGYDCTDSFAPQYITCNADEFWDLY